MKNLVFQTAQWLVVLSLAACAKVSSQTACNQGVCEVQASRLPSIVWNPKNLEMQDCPNISGKYKGKSILLANFYLKNTGSDNKNNSFENIREIPFVPRIKNKVAMPGQKFTSDDSTYIYSDSTDFYSYSHTLILQSTSALTISLVGSDSIVYKKFTIMIELPNIGCSNNEIIIRKSNAIGGAEGGLGSAYADEKHIKKLVNGDLQIETFGREWYYSVSSGLIGIGPNGRAFGINPRIDNTTVIFEKY